MASYYKLPLEYLLNLPYCQRRARINGKVVYYGEKHQKSLLSMIERSVGETGLRFVCDDS